MKTREFFFAVALLGGVAPAGRALACSVCRCGDNAFLFSEKTTGLPDQEQDHRFWLSLGNQYSTKSNALAEDEGPGTERQRELRPSLRAFYSPSDRLSFSVEAPYQIRRIKFTTADGTEQEKSSGLGDIELAAVWTQHLAGGAGKFYTGGLSLTIKIPTGANDKQLNGERVEEHLQAGTGTTDWQLGAAISRFTCNNRIFASAYYRVNGTNEFDYHYGNAVLGNLGAQWPVATWLSGSVQLNGRYARRDLQTAQVVENTGGWMTYLTPGLRLNVSPSASFSTSVQLPVYDDLHGEQSEKAVLSTGLSYEF